MVARSLAEEFWLPTITLVFFFIFQALGHMSELWLTFFAAGVSATLFYWTDRIGERYLYFIGVVVGAWVEVGFRFLGYQQVWTDASFFGVPIWLPLAWGVGFVLITRLGIVVRGIKETD